MDRYTDSPLPPYAYLPGVNPHPTADTARHSYRQRQPTPPWQPPEAWASCWPYLYGCDLFNHGYYWEAHEAWEGLWLGCPRGSTQAHYFQGLIQAANALLKQRMQRPRAVQRLRRDALQHLSLVPDHYMGLAVQRWRSALDGFLQGQLQSFPVLSLSSLKPPAPPDCAQPTHL